MLAASLILRTVISNSPVRLSPISCECVKLYNLFMPIYFLTRYYQVIMTIDIFQYSNMYTLRKSIQWIADEAHVKEECGPYVTKPGKLARIIQISGRL